MIALGPYLIRQSKPQVVSPDFLKTGYAIESAFPEDSFRIPIYRSCVEKPSFDDYYVAEADLPLDVLMWNFQERKFAGSRLLALSALICGLYKQVPGLRDFTQLLTEIRAELPVSKGAWGHLHSTECLLVPTVASQGFEISDIVSFGRNIFVRLCWLFPQDRSQTESDVNLYAGELKFHPTPNRVLDHGKWCPPREHTVSQLLWNRLRGLAPKQPIQLLTDTACESALSKFEWSKLALLTAEEAREARIDFTRQHPELWNEPATLARALLKAELYAPSTSVFQIVKFLPNLMRAAKVRKASGACGVN